jgi:hypothetical protein
VDTALRLSSAVLCAEARAALKEFTAPWPVESEDGDGSPYNDRFRNGAVLWPRRLVIVTEATQGRLGANPAAPIVLGRVTNLDKKPWNAVTPIRGAVEREFLRTVYMGESIAPYRLLDPVLAVIPIEPNAKTVMDARAAAANGYARLSAFLADAESTWRTHSKQTRTFAQQIDFFGNLSGQFPISALRVLYTKTGTNLAAALLRDPEAIVENGLYWTSVASEGEAYYLVAILNSETTRARAEKWQATGQWGARHFDKVIFNLPIPKFEPKTALHIELAEVAKEAEKIAQAVLLKPNEHFTRARKRIRETLADAGIAERIDSLVARLLDKIH